MQWIDLEWRDPPGEPCPSPISWIQMPAPLWDWDMVTWAPVSSRAIQVWVPLLPKVAQHTCQAHRTLVPLDDTESLAPPLIILPLKQLRLGLRREWSRGGKGEGDCAWCKGQWLCFKQCSGWLLLTWTSNVFSPSKALYWQQSRQLLTLFQP